MQFVHINFSAITSPPEWLLIAIAGSATALALGWAWTLRNRLHKQAARWEAYLEKQAELERDYRNLFERTHDVIFRSDIRGRYLVMNPAGAAALGYTPEEMLRLSALRVVSRKDHRQPRRFYVAYRRNRPFSTADVHLLCKDGSERVFEFACEVVQNHLRQPEIQGIGRDITDRLRAAGQLREQETRLQQSQKMEAIGTLAGGTAHDFNNILTGILGYVEMIRADLPSSSVIHPDLDQIAAAGSRAKGLVRQILAYSRRMDHERRPIDLREVATEACKLLRATIPVTVGLNLKLDSAPLHVMADATQMHQVILNLATNAFQVLGESHGMINIAVTARHFTETSQVGSGDLPAGDYIDISVSDNGPGMSAEVISRIFEPYFTTKPVSEGSGLGLAVVHGIVESHGGAIEVKSAVGEGTRIVVRLPACATPPVESTPKIVHAAAGPGHGNILLVDDEAMVLSLERRILVRLGYKVSCAAGGSEALAQLRAEPGRFDLVITDQTMPQMSGLALMGIIQQENPGMPVIICSGYSHNLDHETARSAGAACLLPKPFEIDQLSSAIAEALASRKAK